MNSHNYDDPRQMTGSDLDNAPRIDAIGPTSDAEQPLTDSAVPDTPRSRRKRLPAILFVVTCISTFWAGVTGWLPMLYLGSIGDSMPLRRAILTNWADGLIYTGCLLGILLTHEMGHFVAALIHRIPASLPFFLPMPISPIGTMGAVIGMDGKRADRKEIFDIGIAGPIAGLVVAIPIMWIGVSQLDFTAPGFGPMKIELPLAVRWLMQVNPPPGYASNGQVWYSQLNPYFMAGWVGLLITGLNMLPVSQLDGGHVIYTLFGKRAHWVARGFMVFAIVCLALDFAALWQWILMLSLIMLIGIRHPPTRDDTVPLGWFRIILGVISLLIPLLCFNPYVFTTT